MLKEDSSDDTKDVGRVKEELTDENKVRALGEKKSEEAKVVVTSLSSETGDSKETKMKLLIDSGVNRSLISEQDWNKIKLADGEKPVLKKCDIKFSPFGTKYSLPMMGRTRALLRNEQGGVMRTVVYVVKGEKQSLLGLKDARALGIVKIDPAGESRGEIEKMEPVRTLRRSRRYRTRGWCLVEILS